MAYYSAALIQQVNELMQLKEDQQPIITTFKSIMTALREAGVVQRSMLHCSSLLCHPKNRSGFMLNGFNAHTNGDKVRRVGANRGELHGAVCIELMPTPAERDLQIKANTDLAARSKGLLATPSGKERFLTLGTGHMVSFCRAVLQGCCTPFKTLQGPNGKLSAEVLNGDLEFRDMLAEGWEFDILPWQVEKTWPQLPELIQRALNAANSVAEDATEWEIAISIAEIFSNMEKPDWELAQNAAVAGNPRCAPYIGSIRILVERFGGGAGAPLILEQDKFAKTLGENRRLGQEFTTAIADCKLHAFEPRVHVRHALIAANLTSPKVVDGVAKLITKADLASLASKAKANEVHEADVELGAARGFLERLPLPEDTVIQVLGLLRVRMGAYLCGKGKATFEAKVFNSRREIIAEFLKDLNSHLKKQGAKDLGADLPACFQTALGAIGAGASDAGPSTDTSKRPQTALSIEEVSGKEHAANQKGFFVDGLVFDKASGNRENVFKIIAISDSVSLELVDKFNQSSGKVQVAFDSFVSKWALFKGDVAAPIQGDWSAFFAGNPNKAKIELQRCKLFNALHSLQGSSQTLLDSVQLCIHPSGARAAKALKKGDLSLTPVVPSLAHISTQRGSSSIPITMGDGVVLYIAKAPQPKKEACADWTPQESVNPYWWVGDTTDQSAANMENLTVEVDGVAIPTLTTCRNISSGEPLLMLVSQKRALSSAEGTTVATPAKKPKAKAKAQIEA